MLSDGIPPPRFWPSGTHTFALGQIALAAAQKRLAKICFCPPSAALGSYHASHGTVRFGPAKSIDGASASTLRSMLSGGPCVTHEVPLNARTKISCAPPACCSNVAHGTRGPPASEPPATSETPAF